jgi:hypothetical protein
VQESCGVEGGDGQLGYAVQHQIGYCLRRRGRQQDAVIGMPARQIKPLKACYAANQRVRIGCTGAQADRKPDDGRSHQRGKEAQKRLQQMMHPFRGCPQVKARMFAGCTQ